jgi:hypothetical protein
MLPWKMSIVRRMKKSSRSLRIPKLGVRYQKEIDKLTMIVILMMKSMEMKMKRMGKKKRKKS